MKFELILFVEFNNDIILECWILFNSLILFCLDFYEIKNKDLRII